MRELSSTNQVYEDEKEDYEGDLQRTFEKEMTNFETFEIKEDWELGMERKHGDIQCLEELEECIDPNISYVKKNCTEMRQNEDENIPKIVHKPGTKRKKRSNVWNHYVLYQKDQKYVICIHCSMKISQGSYDPKNKSTAPLKRHLKKHKIKVNRELQSSKNEMQEATEMKENSSLQETVMNAKIELSMAIEELSVIAEQSLKNIHVIMGDCAESKIDELDSAVKTAKILVESLRGIFSESVITDTGIKPELLHEAEVERDEPSDTSWDQPENAYLSDDDKKEDLKVGLKVEWETSGELPQQEPEESDIADINSDIERTKETKESSSFNCDQCQMTFDKVREFKNHKKCHIENQQYSCDQCPKVFLSKSILRQHHLIHTRDRVFYCDQCPKFYNRAGDLKIHQRLHSGDKPYICDQCSKAFAQSQHLKTHKSIHTGDRPFICDKCSKAFAQSSALVRHKRIHNNEKPFLCDQCHKAFVTSGHLKTHIRTHTGEKPLQCDLCPQTFSHYSSRNKHRLTHDVTLI